MFSSGVSQDKIFIQQLKVPVIVGLLPHERTKSQEVAIDIELTVDFKKAAAADNIQSTVDYASVCNSLAHYISSTQFKLLEALAENIAAFIFEKFPRVKCLKLTIQKKPDDLENIDGVGVIIERCR